MLLMSRFSLILTITLPHWNADRTVYVPIKTSTADIKAVVPTVGVLSDMFEEKYAKKTNRPKLNIEYRCW